MKLWDDIKREGGKFVEDVKREVGGAIDRGKDDSDRGKKPPVNTNGDPTAGNPSGPTVPTGQGPSNPIDTNLDPFSLGGSAESVKSNTKLENIGAQDLLNFIKIGQDQGSLLVGGTGEEMGRGRAFVRDELMSSYQGNSQAMNALSQDQNQATRSLRAQQMQSGGGQMDMQQQMALDRMNRRDAANLKAREQMSTLANMSREFRGGASDIGRQGSSYGAMLVGAQPPQYIEGDSGGGWLDGLFNLV